MALLGTPSFFDTSTLIRGILDWGPAARAAHALLDAVTEKRLRDPVTAWHCCLEFYAVTTRLPEEIRLAPAAAARLVEDEILARLRVLQMPDAHRLEFFRAVASEPVIGARIYDTHIAEVARRAGARVVVTENRRDFQSLLRHGIRVMSAAEFAAEARL